MLNKTSEANSKKLYPVDTNVKTENGYEAHIKYHLLTDRELAQANERIKRNRGSEPKVEIFPLQSLVYEVNLTEYITKHKEELENLNKQNPSYSIEQIARNSCANYALAALTGLKKIQAESEEKQNTPTRNWSEDFKNQERDNLR